jgi:hypothetical protein
MFSLTFLRNQPGRAAGKICDFAPMARIEAIRMNTLARLGLI